MHLTIEIALVVALLFLSLVACLTVIWLEVRKSRLNRKALKGLPWMISVHEAGHVVLGHGSPAGRVRKAFRKRRSGNTEIDWIREATPSVGGWITVHLAAIDLYLAGEEAERLTGCKKQFGIRADWGLSSDRRETLKIAEAIAAQIAEIAGGRAPEKTAVWKGLPSSTEAKIIIRQRRKLTRKALQAKRRELFGIASVILADGQIKEGRLEELLGPQQNGLR